jgi:hypothetical protein
MNKAKFAKKNNETKITAEPGKQELLITWVHSGMEKGVNNSHDRLDELLAKIQK